MRKISKTLAVIGLLTPVGASALGIGDIKLRSALNQVLRAEIPLVTSGSESIDEIKVSIASTEAFAKAGVDRAFHLSHLRFSPIRKPDGSYAIQVSSKEPIREPFLNFLVEVNWPQGRLLREFTVLLDPPAAYKENVELAPNIPEVARVQRSAPAVSRAPQSARAVAQSDERPKRIRGTEYGPVRRNETLWSIARSVDRDPNISVEQMAVALYEANPHAFFKESVDALKAGETLRIPDQQTVLRLSRQQAKAKLYGQAAERKGKLSGRPITAKSDGEGETQGKLKLLAPADSKAKSDTLETGGQSEASKAKTDIALEVVDTVRQENEEIRSRLAQLEEQLAGMQRILTVKDEQIASLQQQVKQTAAQPSPSSVIEPESAKASPPQPTKALTGEGGTQTPEASQTIAEPTVLPQPAEVPTPEVLRPSVTEQVAKPTPAKPHPIPQTTPSSDDDQGVMSFISEQSGIIALGAAGTALLGAYFWRGFRRRAALTGESESILTTPARERFAEPGGSDFSILDQTPSEQVAPASRSSFLSEFSTSDFDALGGEIDEVDPISEADVYLAYGRYKQAEELIRHAIAQYPDRDECKLKLLEIHYATENRAAFEVYAKELFNEHKDADAEFWDKVVEMGHELCPDCPLFAHQDMSSAIDITGTFGSEEAVAASLELDDDLLNELKSFELDNEDSSIDNLVTAGIRVSPNTSKPDSKLGSIDATLSTVDFEPPSVVKPAGNKPEATQDTENLIQFYSTSTRSTDASGAQVVQLKRDKTLDDILAEMEGASGTEDGSDENLLALSGERADLGANFDMREFDLDFSLIKPQSSPTFHTDAAAEDFSSEQEVTSDNLGELETQLDLARAFVDMGDHASARQILIEVIERGSDAQRNESQRLLDKLSRESKIAK